MTLSIFSLALLNPFSASAFELLLVDGDKFTPGFGVSPYFPLRDLCETLGFPITLDRSKGVVEAHIPFKVKVHLSSFPKLSFV